MIDLVCFRMHFYYNLSQNIDIFVKIYIFVTIPLKVSKYCDFFLNQKLY